MQKWIILVVLCVILVVGTLIMLNVEIETEYVPEAEIEETDLRKTIVTLYFKNNETNELAKETRLIDSKALLQNPYEELVNMILEGPENSNNANVIPRETKLLGVTFENTCVTLNLSKEFMETNMEESDKRNMIYSIVNTLTELTEVTSVKFLIEGEEKDSLSDIGIDLKTPICRIENT